MRCLQGFAFTFLLLHSAFAQSNDTETESDSSSFDNSLHEITNAFTENGIVPGVIPTFRPSALVTVHYTMAGEEFEIMAGETLITALTDNDPKFSMTLNGTDEDSTPTGGPYVVMLLDPNGSRPENGTGRNQVLHLMRGGFSAGRSDGSIESNTEPIARYSKPAPVGEEVHRYVVLVYNQPDDFEERASDRVDVEERDSFNLTSFVRGTNLGNPIAGTYFLLEPSGTSTSVRSSSTTTRSTGAFNTEGIPPTFTPLIGQGQKHVAALGSLFGLCFAGLTLLVA